MQLTPHDLALRRPVWLALSSMFVNADVALTRSGRAAALAASSYTLAQLEEILIDEVYPACWANLNAVDGEREGFDAAWLEATIGRLDASTQTVARLQALARLAIPESTEWLATRAALAARRAELLSKE